MRIGSKGLFRQTVFFSLVGALSGAVFICYEVYLQSTYHRNRALREAVIAFSDISGWANPTAVTLTLKKGIMRQGVFIPVTRERCEQNLKHALNVLKRKIYRNKARKVRIECVPVLEQDANGRFHYHLAVNRPDEISELLFPLRVKSVWEMTDWGYRQSDFQTGADRGWIEYMTKHRSKSDFDLAIDWGNFHKVG
jgi:hypothetical protein